MLDPSSAIGTAILPPLYEKGHGAQNLTKDLLVANKQIVKNATILTQETDTQAAKLLAI